MYDMMQIVCSTVDTQYLLFVDYEAVGPFVQYRGEGDRVENSNEHQR